MSRFLMTVLCCALGSTALAQFTVSGTVRNVKTNELMVGASVQTETQAILTDDQGHFELKNVKRGKQIFSVRFLGFSEEKKEMEIVSDLSVDFLLHENSALIDEVIVLATRATDNSPTTFSNISKEVIQKQNFGQDLPFVLNWTPSLVTTSDAGTGIGYTGVRIRGSDASRINVTINGIVLNDSEEQGVYWVDVPDIATSTQNIQIQRGVGTSTNGAGAFGGSINLQTNTRKDQPYADVINSFGSFGTHRHTVGFGTGLKNKFAFDARMSLIGSDGYIDRATSDLKSYYLSGGYYGNKTMVKAIVFGGKEITYQSWDGVPQSRLNNDTAAMRITIADRGWNAAQVANLQSSNSRTFNSFTYQNQIDNYAQDHYQLHLSHQVNHHLTANAALHYTYGRGYYEEYKFNQKFSDYGLPNANIGNKYLDSTDLVRRLWLNNHFYGATWSVNYEKEKWSSILGGAFNRYDGDHYGEIIWAKVAVDIPPFYRYYFNNGKKQDFNIFWKNSIQFGNFIGFVDVQYRRVDYNAHGSDDKLNPFGFNVNYNFFNPKIGVTYKISTEQQLYASYCIGNREPVRSDFVQAIGVSLPRHETLYDIEAGWRMKKNNVALSVNYYFMDYNNQLVLTGKLNDVGAPIRTNVADSYRTGIEIDGGIRFNNYFTWNANLTLSQNKIKKFTELLYDYGPNFDQYKEVDRQHPNTAIAFSPSIISGSTFLYRPIKNIEVGLLTKYVGLQYLDNTSNKERSIDPYFINNLRLTYTLKPQGMRELSVSLLINNITDQKYSSNGYTYGYFGGGTEVRQSYFYPQAGRNYLMMVALRF